jgi:hypothetical protein
MDPRRPAPPPAPSPEALVTELAAARDAFLEALGDVEPELLSTPGLVGEWSARELIAHMGYWAGHAAEALHFAAEGRADEFGEAEMDVDERNAVVARVAAESDVRTVREREAAAYGALLESLRGATPALLAERVAYGDTLEQVVRDDGADHYREHTLDIRAWFTGDDEPDDDEPDDDEPDDDEPDDAAGGDEADVADRG